MRIKRKKRGYVTESGKGEKGDLGENLNNFYYYYYSKSNQ
jgi:hypothetical protein